MQYISDLYKQHFIDRDFERLDLFQILAECFVIHRVLYPGSYVHVTPSFVFPITTYVDTDRQARKFFNHPDLHEFIKTHKIYPQSAQVRFLSTDYRQPFNAPEQGFDLLISMYAGFISKYCKRYLRVGGIMLVNNSHGDAGMAAIDRDYRLIAVVQRRQGSYRISKRHLDAYFVPKKPIEITREYLQKLGKGIGYKKTASAYVFERVKK